MNPPLKQLKQISGKPQAENSQKCRGKDLSKSECKNLMDGGADIQKPQLFAETIIGGGFMGIWADKLIEEYSSGREQLKKQREILEEKNPADRKDMEVINGMIDDMSFAIEWMKTGKQPGTFRGIDNKLIYQRRSLEGMDLIPDITEQLDDINEKKLFLTREEKVILADIFASFSLRERQCFILHAAQGLSMEQIADEIGLKKRTVQQYIERARKKVEQRVL